MLIGEVARRSGVSARMLRHYDRLGLVRPTGRTSGGYREYSAADLRRIFYLESLRSLGLSLAEAGRALDDPGFTPAALVDGLIRRTRDRIAAETALLDRLGRIDAARPAAWEDVLSVVAQLQALGSAQPRHRQRAALSPPGELPAEALAEAALTEPDPAVAGALHWALAHSPGDASAVLARGLHAPDADVRARAVRALAELPADRAAAPLREALADPDPAVRRHAALTLGARGEAAAVPALLDLIVDGTADVDAADALAALSAGPAIADRIAGALAGRLRDAAPAARLRLTQALADLPGAVAARTLAGLAGDSDHAVAITAAYLRTRRPADPLRRAGRRSG